MITLVCLYRDALLAYRAVLNPLADKYTVGHQRVKVNIHKPLSNLCITVIDPGSASLGLRRLSTPLALLRKEVEFIKAAADRQGTRLSPPLF